MPDLSTLGLFAIACLALTATPGPDMLLIASRSASQGRASGLATYAGIAAGTYCHALAAAFGLSQLFLAAPIAYDIVPMLARPTSPISPGRRSAPVEQRLHRSPACRATRKAASSGRAC
jgi:hypothetical protein